MGASVSVGISLKAYFTHARALAWFKEVSTRVRTLPAVADGSIRVFVLPGYLQILPALQAFADTPVLVGAQDVSAYGQGPFTGEVSAAQLAEVGVALAEIGHAERRRLFGETDQITAAKASATLHAGMQPVLCVGEETRTADVASEVLAQLDAALLGSPSGAVTVAYEPVWAIGAPNPALASHIAPVTRALRAALASRPDRAGSTVIYGGSAGPGLLTSLGDAVDGLFLGRFAHDPDNLVAVLQEAAALSTGRRDLAGDA
jgi:triosephosphate isomerase